MCNNIRSMQYVEVHTDKKFLYMYSDSVEDLEARNALTYIKTKILRHSLLKLTGPHFSEKVTFINV